MANGPLLEVRSRNTGEIFARAEVRSDLDFAERIELAGAFADDVARSLNESGRTKEAQTIGINAAFLEEPQNRRREQIIGMLSVHG